MKRFRNNSELNLETEVSRCSIEFSIALFVLSFCGAFVPLPKELIGKLLICGVKAISNNFISLNHLDEDLIVSYLNFKF